MVMTWRGRQVVMTELDPVPPRFRLGPGVIVLNEAELWAMTCSPSMAARAMLVASLIDEVDAYDRGVLAQKLGLGHA